MDTGINIKHHPACILDLLLVLNLKLVHDSSPTRLPSPNLFDDFWRPPAWHLGVYPDLIPTVSRERDGGLDLAPVLHPSLIRKIFCESFLAVPVIAHAHGVCLG
jgi:hypothetical protein